MGDVIHNLPVVEDIRLAYPDAEIDWVVEEPYAPLVRLHPGVEQVIPVALRRWREAPFSPRTRREFMAYRAVVRLRRYDAIIDTQALVKSAVIGMLARGTTHGWSGPACRESFASWFYDVRHKGMRYDALPAVQRYRDLVRQVLDTDTNMRPRYGLAPEPRRPEWAPRLKRMAVLNTATARPEKLWHEDAWRSVAVTLAGHGYSVILPWGNEPERLRAERIRDNLPGTACAPMPLSLVEWAHIMASANIVIGVDTGLTFLAAAVGTPVVGIYCATSPHQVGIEASTPHLNLGGLGTPPQVSQVIGTALTLSR
ncbi:lipopolysaccharide heptosyltransferase RfaC [soil metagenome]